MLAKIGNCGLCSEQDIEDWRSWCHTEFPLSACFFPCVPADYVCSRFAGTEDNGVATLTEKFNDTAVCS